MAGLIQAGAQSRFEGQYCGGVKVTPTLVLTAAHCVTDESGAAMTPAMLVVQTGSRDINAGSVTATASILVHPDYAPQFSARFDVALVTLAAPTAGAVAEVISPAAADRAAPGLQARIVGWGCTRVQPAVVGDCVSFPTEMRAATVPIRTDQTCRPSIVGYDPSTMICAGSFSASGAAPDACGGDSGGPLVVRGARGPLIAGLVSYGPGCGGAPTAYTRLSAVTGWLGANGVPVRPAPFALGAPALQNAGPGTPVAGDFDGDRRDDVYWFVDGGEVNIWPGSPSGPLPRLSIDFVPLLLSGSGGALRTAAVAPRGARPVVGDFDGSGTDDILWYRPGPGPEVLWLAVRSTGGAQRQEFLTAVPRQVFGQFRPVVGNFAGSSADDVLWYAPGAAAESMWVGAPGGNFAPAPVPAVAGSYLPVSGDVDGNGFDDIFWFAPGVAPEGLWRGRSAGGFVPGPTLQVAAGAVPLAGDFDGDRRSDVFFYGAGAAPDGLWRGTTTAPFLGRPTDVRVGGVFQAASGDFDGDGRDDVLWSGPGRSSDYLWRGLPAP